MPQVEVKFDIDANGILNVSAKDKTSGKNAVGEDEASTALSKDEIEKLKQEAAAHASEDETKRESAEVRNQAEALIYTSEKALKDAGEKVPADIRTSVSEKIEVLKKAKEGGDLQALKSAVEALSRRFKK